MQLLVDAGNSSIKWNVYDTVSQQFLHAPQSFLWRTENLAETLTTHWDGLNAIESVLLANVGGEPIEQAVQRWLDSRGVRLKRITTQPQAFGVRNGYQVPGQLGIDRWLMVLAAAHIAPGQTACVVSCGTAITVDSVTGTGDHQGGLIIPGMQMMKNALLQHTHGVKIAQQEPSASPYTDSTSAAVNNGVLLAAVSFVDRAVSTVDSSVGGGTVKFITGGDAQLIRQHLRYEFEYEPELVLKGLALYAD